MQDMYYPDSRKRKATHILPDGQNVDCNKNKVESMLIEEDAMYHFARSHVAPDYEQAKLLSP